MDNKKPALFLAIAFLFAFGHNGFGQRWNQSSKTENLIALIQSFKKEEQDFQYKVGASKTATAALLPVKQLDGTVVALQAMGTDGTPLYYSTLTSPTATVSRASSMYYGGTLDLGISGQGMQVGVWDAGIALESHQEFGNRVTKADGSTTVDFHATMVTGVLASSGIQKEAQGVAFEATVLSHNWTRDRIEVAEAAANGLLLSNHSYGIRSDRVPDWYFGSYIKISQDWDNIMYHAPYYLMVSASGNAQNSQDNEAPIYGKTTDGFDLLLGFTTSKNGIVVAGADTSFNGNGILQNAQVSSYSSFGPTDDGRIKPDIAGDGGLIRSTSDNGVSSYSTLRGTSMAAPGVTGSLLLLQSYHEELFGNYMKAASLKGLTLHTADDVGALGPDYKMGWGIINTKRAAEVLSNHGYRSLITETTLRYGESYSITVSANEKEPLMASISWTDPASEFINEGLLNDAAPVLVNDLDLRITKNGATYEPWLLDPSKSGSPAATGDNKVDPFERVEVLQPKGLYTITVTHKGDLVNDAQSFSLILTGISQTDCVLVPPSDIFMDQPTENSISWFWEAQPETLYEIQTQELGTEIWDSQLTWENTVAMDSLEIGTSYKLRLRTLCAATLTSEFSETLEFEFQGTETKLKTAAKEKEVTNGSLTIYPNPADALIQINDAIMDHGASYVITSLSGFVVKQGVVSERGINVADLATGVYLLSIGNGQQTKTSKFFKK